MFFFTVIMYTPLTSGTHAVLQEQGMHYTLLCTTHLSLQFFYNHVQLHLIFTTNQRRMHVFLYCNRVYTPNQWNPCSFTTRHALHTFWLVFITHRSITSPFVIICHHEVAPLFCAVVRKVAALFAPEETEKIAHHPCHWVASDLLC